MTSGRMVSSLKVVLAAAIACGVLFLTARAGTAEEAVFFFSPGCHECAEVKSTVLPRLREQFPGLTIAMKDISVIENYKELLALQQASGAAAAEVKVPALYAAGKFLCGREAIEKGAHALVAEGAVPIDAGETGRVDLAGRFAGFSGLAVGLAGLIDGINPCAFTVIVFFISFLSLQGYSRREIIAVGSAFIAAVFATYFLIGLGLFGFLYGIAGFWAARALVNWLVAALSIALGGAALYDVYAYTKSGSAEATLLRLPDRVKRAIQSVISSRHRATSGKDVVALAAAAFVTGCLVSVLEAVCTGQMYLPTISFILKTNPFNLRAVSFLTLYNAMFVAPLGIVLAFAVTGTSSGQFSVFLKRHLVLTKILMAAVFFGLGIFLFWKG